METLHLQYLIPALVYSIVGILILILAFWIIDRMTPRELWKEIIEKQNMAFALLAASFVIAIALIISSAIHG
jgi:putative membrane protein